MTMSSEWTWNADAADTSGIITCTSAILKMLSKRWAASSSNSVLMWWLIVSRIDVQYCWIFIFLCWTTTGNLFCIVREKMKLFSNFLHDKNWEVDYWEGGGKRGLNLQKIQGVCTYGFCCSVFLVFLKKISNIKKIEGLVTQI